MCIYDMDYGGNERCFVCLETEGLKQGMSKVGKSIVKKWKDQNVISPIEEALPGRQPSSNLCYSVFLCIV